MKLNAIPGQRASVVAFPGHQPPRLRLTIGGLCWTLDADEALELSNALTDAAERITTDNRQEGK
jgi:hypothetical protein